MVLFAKFIIGEGRTKGIDRSIPQDRIPQDRITRPRYMDAQRNVNDIRPLQTKI